MKLTSHLSQEDFPDRSGPQQLLYPNSVPALTEPSFDGSSILQNAVNYLQVSESSLTAPLD